MAGQLAGKKIAVLVESQYIPVEIETYIQRFSQYGATVHLMARLWGKESLTLVSEVENPGETPKTLEVNVDLERVKLEDYAAVVMSANYTSVRLRYFEPPAGQPVSGALTASAPAVGFFSQAMANPNIVKAALCHGLWILTPRPDLLAGRRVICHEVVLSDVVNAGAVYTPSATGVVVDGDLVTGRSYHETAALVDAVVAQIGKLSDRPAPRSNLPEPTAVPPQKGKRNLLVLLSEWGYWGEELVGPLEVFIREGYSVSFVTPTGKRPVAIAVSMDPGYIDPPLGRSVTSPYVAARTRDLDDPTHPRGKLLETPLNLSAMIPERPYAAAPQSVRLLEQYNRELSAAATRSQAYDALLIVGGSGPIVDLANNGRVHDLILSFYQAGKPVAAECYGVACLAFARDWGDRKSIIWGKHVTGHCKEYDYKDGTGFMKSRGQFLDFNMGPPPYPLEYILRDATGPDGQYHGNFGKETSVIVDWPFITGRSTPDSYLTGEMLVRSLDGSPPLKRYGW
jgi:putative intracellular protease/amidase